MQGEGNEVQRAPGQRRLVRFFSAVAADVGSPIPDQAKVLDFGCGDGGAVEAWRATGRDAFGCDVDLDRSDEWLRLIETPYRLPFADATFDLVVSNMVLEHVQDHHAAFREIHRVLRPGAISLHLFPARWTPIEPHLLVPLATVLQEHWWLALWARLGIRNEFQTGLPWREVAAFNVEYLRTRTNYSTRNQLLTTGHRWFDEAAFVEGLALKHGRRTRAAYPLVRVFPPLTRLYGGLRTRLLLLGSTNTTRTRKAAPDVRPVRISRGPDSAVPAEVDQTIDATDAISPRESSRNRRKHLERRIFLSWTALAKRRS